MVLAKAASVTFAILIYVKSLGYWALKYSAADLASSSANVLIQSASPKNTTFWVELVADAVTWYSFVKPKNWVYQ